MARSSAARNLTTDVGAGRGSKEAARVLDRATQAWQLRVAGKSQEQIAKILGVSRPTVTYDLKLMEARAPSITAAQRRDWMALQLERYEAIIRTNMPVATGERRTVVIDDTPVEVEGYVDVLSLKAGDSVMKAMASQATLLRFELVDEVEDYESRTQEELIAGVTDLAQKLEKRRLESAA